MSWEQAEAIIKEDRKIRAEESRRPPVACPIDGTPLDVKGGVRNCPMGNYRWPQ